MPTKEDTIYSKQNEFLLTRIATKDKELNMLRAKLKQERDELKKMNLLIAVAYFTSAFTIVTILGGLIDYIVRVLL
jgi:hypothetical protein